MWFYSNKDSYSPTKQERKGIPKNSEISMMLGENGADAGEPKHNFLKRMFFGVIRGIICFFRKISCRSRRGSYELEEPNHTYFRDLQEKKAYMSTVNIAHENGKVHEKMEGKIKQNNKYQKIIKSKCNEDCDPQCCIKL